MTVQQPEVDGIGGTMHRVGREIGGKHTCRSPRDRHGDHRQALRQPQTCRGDCRTNTSRDQRDGGGTDRRHQPRE
jgi:hypothetical protein